MAKTSTKIVKKSKVLEMPKKKTSAAAAPAAKSSTKEAKPAKKKTAENSKYIGKTSGMRVQAYQDKLMRENYKAKKTDAQLAKDMRDEFPNAVRFEEKHVVGIRSQFNNGRRASQENKKPEKPLAKFDAEGNPVTTRAVTGPKKGAKKDAPKGKKAKPVEEDEEEEDEEADDKEVDEDDEEVDEEELDDE